ncbi:MAG: hypothetical protein AB1817_12480 [Chloroflexota bacterium]
MSEITIGEILDDIRVADEVLHKFERRYWITSEQFYALYSQGRLDDGEQTEDFSEWAGFYKLKTQRQAAFREWSTKRLQEMHAVQPESIHLVPQEPLIKVA